MIRPSALLTRTRKRNLKNINGPRSRNFTSLGPRTGLLKRSSSLCSFQLSTASTTAIVGAFPLFSWLFKLVVVLWYKGFGVHKFRGFRNTYFEGSKVAPAQTLFLKKISGKCKVLLLFEGQIFLLACSVHFVCRRFWAISTESQRSRPNRQRTKCREHASKKISPSKRSRTLHSSEVSGSA